MAEAPPNGPVNPFPPDPLRTVFTCAVAGLTAGLMAGSVLTGAIITGATLAASWVGHKVSPRA